MSSADIYSRPSRRAKISFNVARFVADTKKPHIFFDDALDPKWPEEAPQTKKIPFNHTEDYVPLIDQIAKYLVKLPGNILEETLHIIQQNGRSLIVAGGLVAVLSGSVGYDLYHNNNEVESNPAIAIQQRNECENGGKVFFNLLPANMKSCIYKVAQEYLKK